MLLSHKGNASARKNSKPKNDLPRCIRAHLSLNDCFWCSIPMLSRYCTCDARTVSVQIKSTAEEALAIHERCMYVRACALVCTSKRPTASLACPRITVHQYTQNEFTSHTFESRLATPYCLELQPTKLDAHCDWTSLE